LAGLTGRLRAADHLGVTRRRGWVWSAALVLAAVCATAAFALAGATASPSNHLVLIVMENKSYWDVRANSNAPYLNNTLIPAARLFTKYYASFHPSLPNYLVLTAGDAGGCTKDTCAPGSITGENLFHELDVAHPGTVAWKVYAEGMPGNCYASDSGSYFAHHNPAVYFANLGASGDGSCARNDVPFTQLAADLAAHTLPPFSVVVPDVYDDMHTDRNTAPCSLGSAFQDEICQGDKWLAQQVPPLLAAGDVTVLLVWDEGTSDNLGGGHVLMVEAGAGVAAGTKSSQPTNHYGLANAIADRLGIPRLAPSVPKL
jgi:acid phosphatase